MVGRLLHADSRKSNMKKVIWLASWYPDDISPYNGDFIQRHARAVAIHMPLTVIYMSQHGPGVEMDADAVHTETNGNLTEIRITFRYKRTGIALLDKLRYNNKFFRRYRAFMRSYLRQHGKPDLLHVHIPMKAGRTALWLRHRFGIPFLLTEHSSAYQPEVPDAFQRRGAYYRYWVSRIFREAAAVTTVSRQLGDVLQQLFSLRHMTVIPNVVDTTHFHYDRKPAPAFRFLHASTMNHPKNVEGMLRALGQLKHQRAGWQCVMLGWDTPALRTLATELGLDGYIVWKGVVSYPQVAAEMQQADALLLFSRYESQGCVILEAHCTGLPVIATNVGGIPEITSSADTVLVPSEDEPALLQAMLRMMDGQDAFDRASIAAAAIKKFSYEAVGKQFVELYANS